MAPAGPPQHAAFGGRVGVVVVGVVRIRNPLGAFDVVANPNPFVVALVALAAEAMASSTDEKVARRCSIDNVGVIMIISPASLAAKASAARTHLWLTASSLSCSGTWPAGMPVTKNLVS